MKRSLAIIFVILMLTACAAEKPAHEREERPEEVEVTEEVVQEEAVEEVPAEESSEEPEVEIAEEEVPYESLMVDGVVEDAVGFGFEIPQFDCPGSEAIDEYFDGFVRDMENFTRDVVYENAMSRSCIASVNGAVDSVTMEGGVLCVVYSYECQYSDAQEPEVEITVLRFDIQTGEVVE